MKLAIRSFSFSLMLGLAVVAGACERRGVEAGRDANMAEPDTPAVLSTMDREFILESEKSHIAERNLGRIGLQNSRNDDVKDFAQMLVDDHTDGLRDVVDLMQEKNIQQPKGLDEAKDSAANKLNGLSGPAFDREFVAMMVENHQKSVEKYRRQANAGQDPDVRDYAENLLPALEKHLEHARELQTSVR